MTTRNGIEEIPPTKDLADEPVKTMSVHEFWRLGFIQEINRRVLHPAGLALSVIGEGPDVEHFTATGFDIIWDYRDDPEGVVFDVPDDDKIERVAAERARHVEARTALFGSDIQGPGQRWTPPGPITFAGGVSEEKGDG